MGSYRVKPMRKWAIRVGAEPRHDGFSVMLWGQCVDPMNDHRPTVRPCAILAGTKQVWSQAEQGACWPRPANVDFHRRAAMRLPRSNRLFCMEQAKIVVQTDINVSAGDPIAAAMLEQGRIGQSPAGSHRTERRRLVVGGEIITDWLPP